MTDRLILLTGASRGSGQAYSNRFAKQAGTVIATATVTLAYKQLKKLTRT